MNKKILIPLVAFLAIAGLSATFFSGSREKKEEFMKKEVAPDTTLLESASTTVISVGNNDAVVKEFYMKSFTEVIDGKYHPQFSLKNITVTKGDKVRIKITDTGGAHNFKIDEFNVFTDTPLNKEMTVEFVADKVGTFIYYCAKPGHRALGQWGTLVVKEK